MAKKIVYRWSWAFRIDHWVHFLAMAVLVFTGFYIHGPFLAGGGETMAWTRFSHFTAAYVVILALIVRTYLAFKSSIEPDWQDLLPTWTTIRHVPDMLKYYLFMKDTHQKYTRYNPLQALAYFLMIGVLIPIMIFTGFAIYDGFLSSSFAWVNTLLGGDEVTRLVHYFGMWALLLITVIHVYFVALQTVTDKDKTLHSIVTGYKEVKE